MINGTIISLSFKMLIQKIGDLNPFENLILELIKSKIQSIGL